MAGVKYVVRVKWSVWAKMSGLDDTGAVVKVVLGLKWSVGCEVDGWDEMDGWCINWMVEVKLEVGVKLMVGVVSEMV